RELRAEARRQVVAARLDEDQLERGKAPREARHRLEIDRRILADCRVRAAAGLDADDALGRESVVSHQELRVLLGVDVVRHDRDLVLFAQRAAEGERERRLARADWPPYADS